MRLHHQEKAAQRAASLGRPVRLTWLYDQTRVMVRAKKKLIGFEMKYWMQEPGLPETQVTRRELVAWMEAAGVTEDA